MISLFWLIANWVIIDCKKVEECVLEIDEDVLIDINPIHVPSIHFSTISENDAFFVSVCKPLPFKCAQSNKYQFGLKVKSNEFKCESGIGTGMEQIELIDPLEIDGGVKLTYKNGTMESHRFDNFTSSTEILIICDDKFWNITSMASSFTFIERSLSLSKMMSMYRFQMRSVFACPFQRSLIKKVLEGAALFFVVYIPIGAVVGVVICIIGIIVTIFIQVRPRFFGIEETLTKWTVLVIAVTSVLCALSFCLLWPVTTVVVIALVFLAFVIGFFIVRGEFVAVS